MKILTLADYYLPGYKAGGPIRTLANMVNMLGDEFKFKIITMDRDFKDGTAYPSVMVDGWNRVGKAKVFYMSPKNRSLWDIKAIFCSSEHNAIYLNSFFSPHFTIKPLLLRRFGLIPGVPVIVAPRGEFSPGALGLKSLKKQIYIVAAKAFGLYSGVIWQASSEHEAADIHRWFGDNIPVAIAPNLPQRVGTVDNKAFHCEKTSGHLKIVFLSRISRKKNLDGALKMLNGLNGQIQFNIYGPIEDKVYWAECQKIINRLSRDIKVRYCGSVAHENVDAVMRKHDFFFLPTLGENFGHVILEALCAGCPILISDQTPWRDLEKKGVGWDLPLDQPENFHAVLQKCVDMDQYEHEKWSNRAMKYGLQMTQNDKVLEQNRQLFYNAVQMQRHSSYGKLNI